MRPSCEQDEGHDLEHDRTVGGTRRVRIGGGGSAVNGAVRGRSKLDFAKPTADPFSTGREASPQVSHPPMLVHRWLDETRLLDRDGHQKRSCDSHGADEID